MDIGMQCLQIGNQTFILRLKPEASSGLNTIFMTTYFIGGAMGTFLAGYGWCFWGWNGVGVIGLFLIAVSFMINLTDGKFGRS